GPTRRAFGLQGSHVNLAARLMQAAEPGEVIVDEPLARRLDARFEFGPRRAREIKGRDRAVTTRRLLAVRGGESPNEPASGVTRRDALVGREAERRRLEELARD